MATETIVPSAPAAAPSPAPASSPSSAPASSMPVSAPADAPAPADTPSYSRGSLPASNVDPAKYPIREDYEKALLAEKLGAISSEPDATEKTQITPEPAAAEEPAPAPAEETAPAEEHPAPEAATEEEDFDLNPEPIVTPESLSQMVTENPEFGKLLEADPKLKGQLYKTAREAAELKPYREIFPDIDSAKTAQQATSTFNDVRNTFMGATTREGTIATLSKMAELAYERNENGEVVMEDGQPVIGDDFFGFVDNVAALDLDHRLAEVDARLQANRYVSEEQKNRDEAVKAALDILKENAASDGSTEELPEALRRRQQALEERERALNAREQGAKVETRNSFEQGLQQEAQKRIGDSIGRILANVEKQGAAISPYLKGILPKAIGAKLIHKIQNNAVLQSQMQELQRLPIGDQSRQRRLAAIDRAIQQYLPDVAREELREAGVQAKSSSEAKRAKIEAQAVATRKTEPKGSTGPAVNSPATVTAATAFEAAKGEWQKANPNRPFDSVAKEQILPRVLQLMTQR